MEWWRVLLILIKYFWPFLIYSFHVLPRYIKKIYDHINVLLTTARCLAHFSPAQWHAGSYLSWFLFYLFYLSLQFFFQKYICHLKFCKTIRLPPYDKTVGPKRHITWRLWTESASDIVAPASAVWFGGRGQFIFKKL
jgi:hypothetical protein